EWCKCKDKDKVFGEKHYKGKQKCWLRTGEIKTTEDFTISDGGLFGVTGSIIAFVSEEKITLNPGFKVNHSFWGNKFIGLAIDVGQCEAFDPYTDLSQRPVTLPEETLSDLETAIGSLSGDQLTLVNND